VTGAVPRFVVASATAVVVTGALLTGSELRSSAAAVRTAKRIPAGLAAAIHARLGAGTSRSRSAKAALTQPPYALGESVAMSADGTTALVGAPGGRLSRGAAYVFHVSDAGSWSSSDTPIAVLRTKTGRSFGSGVALSPDGTTAFIGAAGGARHSGPIDVFHVSAEDAWASSSTPTAALRVNDGSHVFGDTLAVSADGTTLIAGGALYSGCCVTSAAYVFNVPSESAWVSSSTPTATLTNATQSPSPYMRQIAVAISGDGMTALVSDWDDGGHGKAYLFHVSAENAWTTSSTPTAILSETGGILLGYSLALSGDGTVAFLGHPGTDVEKGAVEVYVIAGGAAWQSTSTPSATLTDAGAPAYALLGAEAAVSPDGTTALVGAFGHRHFRGAASVFHVAYEGDWVTTSAPAATLTNSAGRANDDLGWAAAISADGATALLGAPGVRFGTGAAQVAHVADASSWASVSAPTATLTVKALHACVVPALQGLTVRAAKSALKARSCRLGKVERVHAKGKKGRVVSQSRPWAWRMSIGAKVNVTVAK
jgi:hypothetical protein